MRRTLPRIVTDSIPGPLSLQMAGRLGSVECAEITYLSADLPIFWKHARGCLVTDIDGNTFLDATSSFGVLGIGHCHPEISQVIAAQSRKLIHGMGDVHPSETKVELLESISSHVPIPDPRIILGQNGSDAIEAALKTAALATGKRGVLAFDGGYHGLSYGALETTARGFFRDPFAGQRGHFASHLPFGCKIERIDEILSADTSIGAVIVEPIQGRGGIKIPPVGWLAALSSVCTKHSVLLIADEIFTGWGRTGDWFACIHESVVPDLICIGKGMGGGMPLSACLGSSALMEEAWQRSSGEARHTYTFLGHPLSCAAALATIRVLQEEQLVERSHIMGSRFLESLNSLAAAYTNLVKVPRGRGMMLALEFDRPEFVWSMVLSGLSKGIILLPAGESGEVLEIVPPFVLTERQTEWSLNAIDEMLTALSRSF